MRRDVGKYRQCDKSSPTLTRLSNNKEEPTVYMMGIIHYYQQTPKISDLLENLSVQFTGVGSYSVTRMICAYRVSTSSDQDIL